MEDINLLIIKQFAVFDVLIAVAAVVEVVREKLKKIFKIESNDGFK